MWCKIHYFIWGFKGYVLTREIIRFISKFNPLNDKLNVPDTKKKWKSLTCEVIMEVKPFVRCSEWSAISTFVETGLYSIFCAWICIYMSHFAYACKMRCPLNLVLEKSEYLWFYWTFCIVILDYGLKLHKLSNHTLVMLQKWLEIH